MTILAVLKKDARRLWLHILLFWALLALSACLDPTYSRISQGDFDFINMSVILGCGVLIVAAIHQEALPGDRQYWLTRPIDRRMLCAAKIAFVFLSIGVPVIIGQLIVWAAIGIPFGEHFTAFFWRQFFFAAFLILPPAMFAAVTRNLAQAFLFTLLILAVAIGGAFANILYLVIPLRIAEWPLDLLRAALLIAAAVAVLAIQYSYRRTAVAYAVISCTGLLLFLTARMDTPPAPKPASTKIHLDPARTHARSAALFDLELPVTIDGVPPGLEVSATTIRFGIGEPGGSTPGLMHNLPASLHDFSAGRCWLTIHGVEPLLEKYLNTPVRFYAVLNLTESTRTRTLPRPGRSGIVVPAIGRCHEEPDGSELAVVCYSPLSRTSLAIEWPDGSREWIVSLTTPPHIETTPLGFRTLVRLSNTVPNLTDTHLVTADILFLRTATLDVPTLRLGAYR